MIRIITTHHNEANKNWDSLCSTPTDEYSEQPSTFGYSPTGFTRGKHVLHQCHAVQPHVTVTYPVQLCYAACITEAMRAETSGHKFGVHLCSVLTSSGIYFAENVNLQQSPLLIVR
jgi:hypothetical protein